MVAYGAGNVKYKAVSGVYPIPGYLMDWTGAYQVAGGGEVIDRVINIDSIITLEAEYSENDELLKKIYIPMGFEVIGKDKDDNMTLMRTRIDRLLSWCHKKY